MISEKLREIRECAEMSQVKVAKILGVQRSTYSGWENNIDPIPFSMLYKFCNYFDIKIDYICNLTKDKIDDLQKNELDLVKIGNRLRNIRLENNDTQKTISDVIGLDQSNYSKIEKGKYLIKLYPLIEFAKYYNISIDYICGRSTNLEICKQKEKYLIN